MDLFDLSMTKLKIASQIDRPDILQYLIETVNKLNDLRLEEIEKNSLNQSIKFPDSYLLCKFKAYFQEIFKNLLAKKRQAYLILINDRFMATNEKLDDKVICFVNEQIKEARNEIKILSEKAEDLIDSVLLKEPSFFNDDESQGLFLKMKADYKRYLFEVTENKETDNQLALESQKLYEMANTKVSSLPPTNAVRLSVALNYSILLYEELDNQSEAIKIADLAFSEALKTAENIDAKDFKESTLLMQLLKDNMTLWKSVNGRTEN